MSETKEIFTKKQILGSKKYAHQRDLIGVLLDDGKNYTFKEVDQKITTFMGKKVK